MKSKSKNLSEHVSRDEFDDGIFEVDLIWQRATSQLERDREVRAHKTRSDNKILDTP